MHNLLTYNLSEDDSMSVCFLLLPILCKCTNEDDMSTCYSITKNFHVRHFAFKLLQIGIERNSMINLLIDVLYLLPRRDILFESGIDLSSSTYFPKHLDPDRVIWFKIYNACDTEEFYNLLQMFNNCKVNDSNKWNLMEKAINSDLLRQISIGDYVKVACDIAKNYLSEKYKYKEDLWRNILDSITDSQNRVCNVSVAIEVGDLVNNPKFGKEMNKEINFPDYNDKEFYEFPTPDEKCICLIINMQAYERRQRLGSDIDVKRIDSVFKNIGYLIFELLDKTKSELLNEINEILSSIESPGANFVCFIMAHGGPEVIYDIKEQEIELTKIFTKFVARKCPKLCNKPKIFFIQACRGHHIPKSYFVEKDQSKSSSVDDLTTSDRFDGDENNICESHNKSQLQVPNEGDFIFGYATTKGFVAPRNISVGSSYIQILCDEVEKHSSKKDILTILQSVNRTIICETKTKKRFCQQPEVRFTLNKTAYLQRPENM